MGGSDNRRMGGSVDRRRMLLLWPGKVGLCLTAAAATH